MPDDFELLSDFENLGNIFAQLGQIPAASPQQQTVRQNYVQT